MHEGLGHLMASPLLDSCAHETTDVSCMCCVCYVHLPFEGPPYALCNTSLPVSPPSPPSLCWQAQYIIMGFSQMSTLPVLIYV